MVKGAIPQEFLLQFLRDFDRNIPKLYYSLVNNP